jgi:hypothetical protein
MSGKELSKGDAASARYVGRDIGRDRVKRRVLAKVVRDLRFALISLEDRIARL